MNTFNHLIEVLAANRTQDKGITFLNNSNEDIFLSYDQLYENAHYLLFQLQKAGMKEGSHVLFQLNDLERFITLFWACVMGKIIPIPLEVGANQDKAKKLHSIWKLLNDIIIVTDEDSLFERSENFIKDDEFNNHLKNNTIEYKSLEAKEQKGEISDIQPNDICYVQFSSGSTGIPKGVPLTHKNIITNVVDFSNALSLTSKDSFISWKPLVHDFSMTNFHIMPLYLQSNHYRIPTDMFVKNPSIWFSAVNKYRISVLGSPNFGFRHFLKFYKRHQEFPDWDFSCINVLQSGAETISPKLLNEFFEEMEQYNLDRNTFAPGYGLAEATLVVSITSKEAGVKQHSIDRRQTNIGDEIKYVDENDDYAINYVDVGDFLEHNQVKITDNEGNTLGEGFIGRINVKGDNVIKEYYKNPEATARIIKDGWVDTGDLGFVKDNRLTFTGRLKEIIVINGVNYYPYDIEEVLLHELNFKELNKFIAVGAHNPITEKEELVIFSHHKGSAEKFVPTAKQVKQIILQKMGLMVSHVIPVKLIPKTTSGKVKRHQLIASYQDGDYTSLIAEINRLMPKEKVEFDPSSITTAQTIEIIQKKVNEVAGVMIEDFETSFFNLGIKSMHIVTLKDELEESFEIELQATDLFDYPNINDLSAYIEQQIKDDLEGKKASKQKATQPEHKNEATQPETEALDDDAIAIVGVSCRFPGGSNSPEEFWETLIQGTDGIVPAPADRWDVDEYLDEDGATPGKMYTPLGGFIDAPIREFDAQFFNVPPKEARAMDPQQRLLLEVSWEAFEDAGIDPTTMMGTETGVFLGMSGTDYSRAHLHSNSFDAIDAYSLTGSTFSTACGRLSYFYGVHGPSFTLDTACSSGLVALHCAFQSIRNGESDMALVGSSHLMLGPEGHIGFSKLGAISPDGHSKTFDESANGYARSEGCGVIILKKLSEAKKDNDRVIGIVRGTAVNQDGRSNGLTAPSGLAQQKVIWSALESAGLKPNDVDYIEAHGTGTPLGDPIEVNALAEIYGKTRTKEDVLKLGSVKSNIGHLEPVAGLAGISKILLSMEYGLIPANLNFNNPNKLIDWDNLPIEVVDEHTTWPKDGKPRRAGINSFGFGGTNAHAIIEEAPELVLKRSEEERPQQLMTLSAKSVKALKDLASKYIHFFATRSLDAAGLADVCYTANTGRAQFNFRLAVVGATQKDFLNKLTAFVKGEEVNGLVSNAETNPVKNKNVVFLFTGQGSQYVGMAKSLYEHNDVFRAALDQCDKLFFGYILTSIKNLIYGENATDELVNRTDNAQPLIFSIEYALAKVWESFGVKPSAIAGHSIGEFAGAVISGVLKLEDAVKLVAVRGRLMNEAPGNGVMVAVFADESTVKKLIEGYSEKVSIAAINMKTSIVISGEEEAVREIQNNCSKQGVETKNLVVSHAFHSPLMQPVLENFEAVASTVDYSAPELEYVSTLHGAPLEAAPDAKYWAKHLRNSVRFYDSVKHFEAEGYQLFVEIGATPTLTSMAKRSIDNTDSVFANSLKKGQNDWQQLLLALGNMYCAGVEVDWKQFDAQYVRKKVSLPKYPFQRSEFWMELSKDVKVSELAANGKNVHPVLGEKITSPAAEDVVIFQAHYTYDKPYFMYEHIIFDTRISPAAAYCSLMLSVVKELYNVEEAELRNVDFVSPLITSEDEERLVQIIINKNGNFRIMSRDFHNEADDWTEHSYGEVYPGRQPEKKEKIDIQKLKKELTNEVTHKEVYDVFDEIGFALDEGFRRIMHTWRKDNLSLNRIEAKTDIPGVSDYRVYPGVIDSIFQTQIQLVLGLDRFRESQSIFIPFSIASMKLYKDLPDNIYCYSNGEVQDTFLKSNLQICDDNGEVFMEISECVGRRTDRPTLLRELNKGLKNSLYNVAWEAQTLENALPFAVENNETYIVFADAKGYADRMIANLNAQKASVIKVVKGEAYAEKEISANAKEITINEQQKDDFMKLLPAASSRIIFGWGLDATPSMGLTTELLKAEQQHIVGSLMTLVQSILAKELSGKTKISVVTKSSILPTMDFANANGEFGTISQATLWGFVRSAMAENAEMWQGIIDIDNDSDATINNLLIEITQSNENQTLLKGGERYVARFNKVDSKKVEPKEAFKIEEDATYLITGGLGDLGLLFTRWLVSNGAKNIVLTGRSKLNDERAKLLEEFSAINVEYIPCDVANEASVMGMAEAISTDRPALRGIIHSAGYLDDGFIADQTWERFEKVFATKVYGTWNLHRHLGQGELDFFFMFSSIVAAMGNMGQANYAAANEFMNQIAWMRRKNGQAAMSINWGPWAEIGMAARQQNRGDRAANRGMQNILPKDGITAFEKLQEMNIVSPVIININWQEFSKFVLEKNKNLFANNLKKLQSSEEDANEGGVKAEILSKLAEAPADERYEILLEFSLKTAARVAGLDDYRQISPDVPVLEQGLDSLVAVDIRNSLSKTLGIELPAALFFNYPSIGAISENILQEYLKFDDESEEEVSDDSADDVLNELNALIQD